MQMSEYDPAQTETSGFMLCDCDVFWACTERAKEQLNRLCLKIATDTENLCVCTQGVVQQWPTAC